MMKAPAMADATALLEQARAGDAAARGELLEAHRPYLTLLARVQIGRQLQGKADPASVDHGEPCVVTVVHVHEPGNTFGGFGGRVEPETWPGGANSV